jgi:hypothetical protein
MKFCFQRNYFSIFFCYQILFTGVTARSEYLLTLMFNLVRLERARIQRVQYGTLVELLVCVLEE